MPESFHESVLPTLDQRLADAARELASDGGQQASGEGDVAWHQLDALQPELSNRVRARALGITYLANLSEHPPSAEFVERIPISFARRHGLIGLAGEAERLQVAMADLAVWQQLDVVSRFLRRPVEPVLAPTVQVTAAINAAYQQRSGQAQTLIETFDQEDLLEQLEPIDSREDLLDVAGRAPVIKLVSLILFEAVKGRASDVHVQPYEDRLVIRVRIDGMLFDAFTLPKGRQEEIISRVKVLGRMNIAEKRLPQDGRATVQVGDRLIDLRIASLPTSHGERVVIRLLDKSARLYTLGELGMQPETLARFRQLIGVEHGIALVTGPTGSGKSTTLYASLLEIDTKNRNVLTLEDPIEYQLEGISQTQISGKKGMTFASGLRSVLRQDPDIVMVGEIRDRETAEMAIQSALTGHLVFSTLHTNDAASAVTRLLDLGIESFLVASSVIGVLAQRLVRQICPDCAEPFVPPPAELRRVGIDPDACDTDAMRRGRGCEACRQSGYRERIGVFELLTVDEAIRRQVNSRANASEIRASAVSHGMKTLLDDGVSKIHLGQTTVDEVARVAIRAGD